MIITTRTKNGIEKYFDSFTGKEVRHERRMPDYAYGFLSQPFKRISTNPTIATDIVQGVTEVNKIVKGWFTKLIDWFKSLFNGKR